MAKFETLKTALADFAQQHNYIFSVDYNECNLEVPANELLAALRILRDQNEFKFNQLVDVAGIDYLEFSKTEWKTKQATGSGFSRGVKKNTFGRFKFDDNEISNAMEQPRYAVVYQLLSIENNQRVRVKSFCEDNEFPIMPSVCAIWNSADWYEREAFDLFGIVFDGHPDMRRILTDYGFVGHPLRKDFPLVGNVEVRFDPGKQRVVYEPVSIEPRVLVPKVIREDNRYEPDADDA